MMLLLGQNGAADTANDAADEATNGAASEPLTLESVTDTLISYAPKIVGVLIVLCIAWIIAGWVNRLVRSGMMKARIDQTLSSFIGRMAKWALLLFAVLGCLGWVGVDVTAFAAVIAAAGFAVGLAFQGTLSNFSAGVMLLVFRPFKIGDVVEVGGVTGTVYEIELFTTSMDTFDNRRIIVPNSEIFGSTIENKSFHPTRRVDVEVGTDYGADIDQAREVLTNVATEIEGRLPDKDPAIVLTGLGGSSIDWSVRVWVNSGDFWPVKDRLTRNIKYALDEAGIGIPFPQMDVHVDGVGT